MHSFTSALTNFLRRTTTRYPKQLPKPPASKSQQVNWEASIDALILRRLHRELAHLRRDGVRASHWVIGPEWWQDILRLRDANGNELYTGNPEAVQRSGYLYGVPVQVQPWATFPVLVPIR